MPAASVGERHGNGDDQAEVIAFLGDPASYSPRPSGVDRFETHGALVFVAGDEAWKIKRAVRFPYMDFSTLAKRKAVCAREVEINRRLAPELYLGCVPITRADDGSLQRGGDGTPVEWAVRMRAFDQTALLSRVAGTEPLSPELVRDLADAVLESHRSATVAAGAEGRARFARLLASISGTLAGCAGVLDAAVVRRFDRIAAEQLDGAAAVLDQRAAAGYVRRCHGDLHLNNIVMWRGRPVLFDAIEFDDDLATIDTFYDLAFLLMDLEQRGQRPAANAVLNRYLWRSGADLDLQGLRGLPLFLGLRSAVRAMVTAERAEQERGAAAVCDRQEARRYLDAAIDHLSPAAPRLVAVGGLSGTGKSTLGRAMAPAIGPAPGAVHLRSDLERKTQHAVGETVHLGAEAYTAAARAAVYAELDRKARLVLAAGHSCIVDAVFVSPRERADIEAVAQDAGVPFQGLWLEAPAERLIARVAARTGDASDATPDVVRQQLVRDIGVLSAAWSRVDAGTSPPALVAGARMALGLAQSDQAQG